MMKPGTIMTAHMNNNKNVISLVSSLVKFNIPSFAVKQVTTVNTYLLRSLLQNSPTLTRCNPVLTSHVCRGKHHRCVQQHGQTVLVCETGGTLSHPQQQENRFETALFFLKAEKPEKLRSVFFNSLDFFAVAFHKHC